MDYLLLKQADSLAVKRGEITETDGAVICKSDDIQELHGVDFLEREGLASDRLKLLLEAYLVQKDWRACIFVNPGKAGAETFWFLDPEEYTPAQTGLDPASILTKLYFSDTEIPRIFTVKPEKGVKSLVLHLSVAESILRRGILGLRMVPLSTEVLAEKKNHMAWADPDSPSGREREKIWDQPML